MKLMKHWLVTVAVAYSAAAFAGVPEGIGKLESGDVAGSVKEFQSAFEAGDPDGAFYIARLFELGLGADPDPVRAVELYAAAASRGSAKAQNRLGLFYLSGDNVLQDYARAYELICQAADSGDQNGQFNCGLLYSEGKGVAQDWAKALQYWQKASGQYHVAAINYLGIAAQKGNGGPADPAKSVAYFQRTAAAGNSLGLFEMAKAYEQGTGISSDLVKAHGYANLAAARGLREAAVLRDNLAARLSPEDLGKAQAFAREWKPVPIEKSGK